MKKIILSLFLIFPLFYSCKSVPLDLKTYSPAAVISVYSNPSVPWYNERTNSETVDDGILSGAVNRLINKTNPEVETSQERINQAASILYEKLKDSGLEVITPQNLENSSVYKNTGKDFFDYIGNTVPAAGYNAITSSNGKLNRMLCKESGAKSVLYVNFRFQKVLAKDGVRNKGVSARLVMTVFATDSNGKKIISREYKAVSENYTPFINTSNWDKEELISFFPVAGSK